MRAALFLPCWLSFGLLWANSDEMKFRITFKDKAPVSSLLKHPEQFLSERALARREQQQLVVDSTDLPIAPSYKNAVASLGFRVVSQSKWMNTVVVSAADSVRLQELRALPFVNKVELVWLRSLSRRKHNREESQTERASYDATPSGPFDQLDRMNLRKLHQKGYRGAGVHVAILDAGFAQSNIHPEINHHLLGVKDFVYPTEDVLSGHEHGTNVLSVLAYAPDGSFSGSAPEASYWLLRTEDDYSECPVEEDYWIAAAEYADSVGVDVINSSLGYTLFDTPFASYSQQDLTGHTAYITCGANRAVQKGMLVVCSAGNEGDKEWETISFPSDAYSVLCVGATDVYGDAASFSGRGFVKGDFVKPNLTALGEPTYVMSPQGVLYPAIGTSFSGPLLAGAAVCLWQSFPQLTSLQLFALLQHCGNLKENPDACRGKGELDALAAYESQANGIALSYLASVSLVPLDERARTWVLNDVSVGLSPYRLMIYSATGQIVESYTFNASPFYFNLIHAPAGVYFVRVVGGDVSLMQRIYIR